MKKMLALPIILVLLLVSLVPVSFAAAQSGTSTDAARPTLTINAPQVVLAGEEFKIQVVNKPGGLPVSRAGLWAVNYSEVSTPAADAASAASGLEIFLGWTDNNGVLVYAFKSAGFYFLVTFKDGYNPGFNGIQVKAGQPALAIKVPGSAYEVEPVTSLVYDRSTGIGAAQAGVWAVSANLTLPPTGNTQDTLALVRRLGQFLGTTDNNGKLVFKLESPGRYLLVAVKDSYIPGFAKINILPQIKALVIRAPAVVKVLEPFPVRVVQRSVMPVEIPVPKAGVWAISSTDVAALDENSANTALAQKYGLFLGWTDEQGYVNPQPSINRTGKFWLVAIKDSYQPGVTTISVLPLVEATAAPLGNSIITPPGVTAIK